MMKTKQEYIEALNGMEEVYDNLDGCMSAMNMFKEGVNLLTGLINEHFEERQETNFEHYKDEIRDADFDFAVRDGKVIPCDGCPCSECLFFGNHTSCSVLRIEWLYQKYQRKYKLTQSNAT